MDFFFFFLQREPMVAESKDSRSMPLLETPRHGFVLGRHAWEYDVPELRIPGVQVLLRRPLGSTHFSPQYAHRPFADVLHLKCFVSPLIQESVDLDEATQDFHLSPPRATREIYEISTPEMPDLSSVTQDICKVRSHLNTIICKSCCALPCSSVDFVFVARVAVPKNTEKRTQKQVKSKRTACR